MASVSSLDQDMRNLRMSRYTPQAANEVRIWIEETLNEPLPAGDLLEALKDGVALCQLANLAHGGGIKFKKSGMPFIQMENISHFLKACEMPPLNMPAHDRFLTVDLFESKDPAQVLQCLSAFSRAAHATNPSRFRTIIGPKKSNPLSPTSTGAASTNGSTRGMNSSYKSPQAPARPSAAMPSARAMSPALTGGSTGSRTTDGGTKSPAGPVSSWSKRGDEGTTSPAWNIHQYGYMGGASQGNQGVSFGSRRQITSSAPQVPSLAEKERKRREKAGEDDRLRQQAEEAEYRRRVERDAEEERDKLAEEQKWEEETRRIREEERRRVEEQKRQWEEQERKWQEEDEARRTEEAEMKKTLQKPPQKPRVSSSSVLRGQSLSQYQSEQAGLSSSTDGQAETPEQRRVRELEKQLEEARERERQYQTEREERLRKENNQSHSEITEQEESATRPQSARESEASWAPDEREYLRQQWQSSQNSTPARQPALGSSRPLPEPRAAPSLPSRPLPEPEAAPSLPSRLPAEAEATPSLPSRPLANRLPTSTPPRMNEGSAPNSSPLGSASRPLPNPTNYQAYQPTPPSQNRTERFLSSNLAPSQDKPRVSSTTEAGDTALEQQSDRDHRLAAQQKTKAGGWASKSLLEREMERERERQREWEANQETVKAAPRDATQGTGQGQSWNVNQYEFMGGDSQNKGASAGSGINFGGRRQILGPRPKP